MKLDEGNLILDFSGCRSIKSVARFDTESENANGLKAVDFEAETSDCLIFIEVKDFQHPSATLERRKADFQMLSDATKKEKNFFTIEMGQKIKDSLLRKYSLNKGITKDVVYLLFINADKFSAAERIRLKDKINGHIPTGLNDSRFSAFTNITFELVNAEQLRTYGIICTAKI